MNIWIHSISQRKYTVETWNLKMLTSVCHELMQEPCACWAWREAGRFCESPHITYPSLRPPALSSGLHRTLCLFTPMAPPTQPFVLHLLGTFCVPGSVKGCNCLVSCPLPAGPQAPWEGGGIAHVLFVFFLISSCHYIAYPIELTRHLMIEILWNSKWKTFEEPIMLNL